MKKTISRIAIFVTVISLMLALKVFSVDFKSRVIDSKATKSTIGEPLNNRNSAIFLKIEGIDGESTSSEHENEIEILSFGHEVVSPRDAASGLPTGKRQHKPVTITKRIDKASPLLMNALVNNQNLEEVNLIVYKKTKSKRNTTRQVAMTIRLQNASISKISMVPFNKNTKNIPTEHISFTYQKIIWTWEDGGITAEDDWESPES